jgi:hypothetical protein
MDNERRKLEKKHTPDKKNNEETKKYRGCEKDHLETMMNYEE